MNRRLAIAIDECMDNGNRVAEVLAKCIKFTICEINSYNEIIKKEDIFRN